MFCFLTLNLLNYYEYYTPNVPFWVFQIKEFLTLDLDPSNTKSVYKLPWYIYNKIDVFPERQQPDLSMEACSLLGAQMWDRVLHM